MRVATIPIAIVLLIRAASLGATPEATPGEQPAALVDGVPIPREAVHQLVKGLARAEPSPPDRERIGELTSAALESLIDLELLYQEAERRHIEIPNDVIDREVATVRQHFDSEEAFVAALASRGMTPNDLRLDTRRTLMADRLLQSTVWRGLSVHSDEVSDFYEENRAQLSSPLDELDESIARMLLDEKKAARRSELVAELRDKASIVRFPPYGEGVRGTPTAAATPASSEDAGVPAGATPGE